MPTRGSRARKPPSSRARRTGRSPKRARMYWGDQLRSAGGLSSRPVRIAGRARRTKSRSNTSAVGAGTRSIVSTARGSVDGEVERVEEHADLEVEDPIDLVRGHARAAGAARGVELVEGAQEAAL